MAATKDAMAERTRERGGRGPILWELPTADWMNGVEMRKLSNETVLSPSLSLSLSMSAHEHEIPAERLGWLS